MACNRSLQLKLAGRNLLTILPDVCFEMAVTATASGVERSTDAQVEFRSADVVMASGQLGAARLTKFSFNRSMLRRAFTQGWRVERERFEMDADGRGHAAYRVEAEGRTVHFVAFTTTTVAEVDHTDRVVADSSATRFR